MKVPLIRGVEQWNKTNIEQKRSEKILVADMVKR